MGKMLLQKAEKPVISVSKDAMVIDAVRVMVDKRVGAAVVLENGRAAGIFTERDLMAKVVLRGLDPAATKVSAVMTSPVQPIGKDADPEEALQLMLTRHFRHLPIVDPEGRVLGMLSMRHLMQDEIDSLRQEVGALEAYAGFDGVGG